MTDFVLWQIPKSEIDKRIVAEDLVIIFENYANFLKQPLKLWMFSEEGLFEYNIFFSSFDEDDMSDSCIEDLLRDDFEYILSEKTIKKLGL